MFFQRTHHFRTTCNILGGVWFWTFVSFLYADKDLDCVFLGKHLAYLFVLHDLLSSLNAFSWKIFILHCLLWHKSCNSFGIWKLWQHNVRITGKYYFFKFSHILSKHLRNQTLVSMKKYDYSNDASLLAILCRGFLRQWRGGVRDKRGGTKQRKQNVSPDTYLHAAGSCHIIYFLFLHILCRELPQPEGWHDAIYLSCSLPLPERCGFTIIYWRAAFAVSGLAFVIIHCENIM